MSSLREMRRRVGSVKSIRQITKAMKMVAAARLRRAQQAIMAARPYAQHINKVLGDIAARSDVSVSPFFRESKGGKILLVVITADKGLCGSFNVNILRRAQAFLKKHANREVEVITVGKKGRDFLTRRDYKIMESKTDVFRDINFDLAVELRDLFVDPFLNKEADEVYFIYNEFKSAMAQDVVCRQLLPVIPSEIESEKRPIDFEFEPSAQEVFSQLLPHHFAVQIWTALLESYSAELGARMTAMDAATNNATDMIDDLTIVMNRIRQANITKELAEIVSGAEALR